MVVGTWSVHGHTSFIFKCARFANYGPAEIEKIIADLTFSVVVHWVRPVS